MACFTRLRSRTGAQRGVSGVGDTIGPTDGARTARDRVPPMGRHSPWRALFVFCLVAHGGHLAAPLHGAAALLEQAPSRGLRQQSEPRPVPWPDLDPDLPPTMRQPWLQVFPQQWSTYTEELRAMRHVPQQTLTGALQLLRNVSQLNPAQLRRSVAYQGGLHRLRRVVRALQRGEAVKLGVLGGSISWGSAVERGAADWFSRLVARLQEAFPAARVAGRNGCVPATPSSFMNVCLEQHLDQDVDLVFLEYATNDGYDITDRHKKRTFERLLRKVLGKPRAPAVVLLQLPTVGQAFSSAHPHKRGFWETVEDVYGAHAAYYDLPYLSMRNAIWRLAQLHHYQMNFTNFYGDSYDFVHPLDYGHAAIADIAAWLLHVAVLDVGRHPWGPWDEQEVALPLPEPMFQGNYEEVNKLCVNGKALAGLVSQHGGWDMVNEGNDIKPKWGFVTRKVGAPLELTVNSSCSRGGADASKGGCTVVQLAYLRSYAGMGRAAVRCHGGCSCQETVLDAHHRYRYSTVFLLRLRPTPAPSCGVSVTVLEGSSSGGHKFKVSGVMASEVRHGKEEDWRAAEVKLNNEEWLGGVNRGDTEMRQKSWGRPQKSSSSSSSSGGGGGGGSSGGGGRGGSDALHLSGVAGANAATTASDKL